MPRKRLLKLRRDTSANWIATNPVLADGEQGLDTSIKRIKIGNGVSAWNDLPFFDAIQQEIWVSPSGNQDFTSVKAAITAITDASAAKPYVVKVLPGFYNEEPFQMKKYVSVIGDGSYYNTILKTTDNANHFVTAIPYSEIRGLALEGPTGNNQAAVYFGNVLYADRAIPFKVIEVAIRKGYYGVYAYSDGEVGVHDRSKVHCFGVANYYVGSDPVGVMFRAEGKTNMVLMNCAVMSGRANTASASGVSFQAISDANNIAEMTLDLCSSYSSNIGLQVIGQTHNAVVGDRNSYVRMTASSFTNGITAIQAQYADIEAAGCVITHGAFTTHMDIDAHSTVAFSGAMNKGKLTIATGGILSASFTDQTPGEEGQVVIGELWLGDALNKTIPVKQYGLATYSTGWESGGGVAVNATALDADVLAGTGYINNGVSVRRITWNDTTVSATDNTEKQYVYVTDTNTVAISVVEPDYAIVIMLAILSANSNDITFLADHRIPVKQIVPRMANYLEEVIGPIAVTGGAVYAHDINNTVELTVEAGSYFLSFEELLFAGGSPLSEVHAIYRNAGGWKHNKTIYQAGNSFNVYDENSGTPVAISTGKFVKHLLYVNVSSSIEYYHLVLGQVEFDSQVLAAAGENPTAPSSHQKYAMRLAAVIMNDAGHIVQVVDQRPKLGQAATATTGVTSHNDMSGKQGGVAGEFYHLSAAQVAKLEAVPEGAEANVNADWNATSGDAEIMNKPTLGTAAAKNVPSSGNAATNEVVLGNDTRLANTKDKTAITGILKGDGSDVTAAVAGDFPTLNQSTTGTAAKATNMVGGNATTLLGTMFYQSNTDTTTALAPNTTTTKKFLTQTGDGTNGAAPTYSTIAVADVPPAGSNKQIMFNDNGVRAGDAGLTYDKATKHLDLLQGAICLSPPSSAPVAEPGEVILFDTNVAERHLPTAMGPSGVSWPLQSHIGFQRVVMVTSTGAAYTSIGCVNPTDTGGTNTFVFAASSANIGSQMPKALHMTGATAGTICYTRHGSANECAVFIGNAAKMGGFFYTVRFGINTLCAGNICFIGLTPRQVPTATANTNTYLNTIGLTFQANSGNFFVTTNNGSGTATQTDLGATMALNITDAFEFSMFCAPNSNQVYYKLKNLSTGVEVSGAFSAAKAPAANTALTHMNWISNNATAATCGIMINKYYIETDF